MVCSIIKIPGGGVAIVKHSARTVKCKFCHQRSSRLCDAVIAKTLGGEDITCDAPICGNHARVVGPDKDFCPKHAG
jgi:hypothetical protein